MEVIDGVGRAPLIDEAAQIWAEATAARDGRDQMPSLEVARPVIQGVDNSRATSLYERLGWRAIGLPTAHPKTGKPEQRYELRL